MSWHGAVAAVTLWQFASVASVILKRSVLSAGHGGGGDHAQASPFCLSVLELAVGGLCSLAILTGRVLLGEVSLKSRLLAPGAVRDLLPVLALHALGSLLTNESLAQGSASLVYVFKVLEPGFTVAFSFALFRLLPHPGCIVAMLPVCSGVVLACFAGDTSTLTAQAVLYCALANAAFSLRAVLFKGSDGGGSRLSGLDSFLSMNLVAFLPALVAWALLWMSADCGAARAGAGSAAGAAVSASIGARTFDRAQLLAAAAHWAQHALSFAVLQRLSALSHSVAGVSRRVAVVLAARWWFATPLSGEQWVGVFTVFAGLAMYSRFAHEKQPSPPPQPSAAVDLELQRQSAAAGAESGGTGATLSAGVPSPASSAHETVPVPAASATAPPSIALWLLGIGAASMALHAALA